MQSAHTWRSKANGKTELPDLLTTDQVSDILNVSKRSVIRWRNERVGPPWCKLGRQVRYRRESLNSWIANTEQQPVRGVA